VNALLYRGRDTQKVEKGELPDDCNIHPLGGEHLTAGAGVEFIWCGPRNARQTAMAGR